MNAPDTEVGRIERRFASLRDDGRAGLVAFVSAGDPDFDRGLAIEIRIVKHRDKHRRNAMSGRAAFVADGFQARRCFEPGRRQNDSGTSRRTHQGTEDHAETVVHRHRHAQAVMLGEELELRAAITGRDGRKLFVSGTATVAGQLVAEASALFVIPRDAPGSTGEDVT